MRHPDKKQVITAEKAKALIKAIESLDLCSTEAKTIIKLIAPLTNLPRRIPVLPSNLVLYRVRVCDKPSHVGELSYPPPQYLKDFGRANLPGRSVFYCCNVREAPFYELRPEVGQTAVISCWVTTADLIVNPVGFTQQTFSRLNLKGNYDMNWMGSANQIVNEFFEKAFTRVVSQEENYLYKLSAAIAQIHYGHPTKGLLGIIYPSIPLQANAINFALKPRFVDSNLRFDRAEFIQIDAVHDSTFDFTITDVTNEISRSGSIAWKGRTDAWVLRNKGDQLTIAIENGKHVARDESGNIVDTEPTVADHIDATAIQPKFFGIIKEK